MHTLIMSDVFEVEGQEYEVQAVSDGSTLRVLVFQGDCQVGLPSTVEQHVRSDVYVYWGVDALDVLMDLAEQHMREEGAWQRFLLQLDD